MVSTNVIDAIKAVEAGKFKENPFASRFVDLALMPVDEVRLGQLDCQRRLEYEPAR